MKIKEIENIFTDIKPRPYGNYSYFSVLVPLVDIDGRIHLLFEVRSKKLSRSPNEVCFPGGNLEQLETPIECAIRETSEELVIPEEKIRVITELDYIVTYTSSTLYAFLGKLNYEDIEMTNFNKSEVEELFLVPLDFFLENEPECHTLQISPNASPDFPYHLIENGKNYDWNTSKIPVFIYQYKDKVIWGLTARIIKSFITRIKNSNE